MPQTSWALGKYSVPLYNPYDPTDKGGDFLQASIPTCNNGKGQCWTIPGTMMDPVGLKILSYSPAPNTGAPGQLTNNYASDPTAGNQTNQFDIRIDHSVTSNINVFGRYSLSILTSEPRPEYDRRIAC